MGSKIAMLGKKCERIARFYTDRALFDAPYRPAGTFAQIEVLEASAKHVFALPGDRVRHVHLVVGGLLWMARLTRDGREIPIAFVRSGEPVTQDRECRYLVRTESVSIVALVPRELFHELRSQNSRFAQRVEAAVIRRAVAVERRLEFIGAGSPSVQTRVAMVLDELCKTFADKSVRRDASTRIPRFSHETLAKFAGTSRPSVSIALGALRRAGVVSTSESEMLVNRSLLAAFVG